MMKEPKNLAEWLEIKGNPKHSIAKGDGENMVIALADDSGMTLYNFVEKENPFGGTYFWVSSGWCVRKEFFPAMKNFLNDETSNASPESKSCTEPKTLHFEVLDWYVDSEGDNEYERRVGIIDAVSENQASALLMKGINKGEYPKGAWLVYKLDGKRIELDTKGRIPA